MMIIIIIIVKSNLKWPNIDCSNENFSREEKSMATLVLRVFFIALRSRIMASTFSTNVWFCYYYTRIVPNIYASWQKVKEVHADSATNPKQQQRSIVRLLVTHGLCHYHCRAISCVWHQHQALVFLSTQTSPFILSFNSFIMILMTAVELAEKFVMQLKCMSMYCIYVRSGHLCRLWKHKKS